MGSSPSVLIIEYNEGHSFLIEEQFRTAFPKAEIRRARTLGEASAILPKMKWDLVILNSSLPDGRGSDILDQISERNPFAAVAILTENPGESSDDDLLWGSDHHGAVEIMTKDSDSFNSFLDRVKRLLETSGRIHRLLEKDRKQRKTDPFRDPLTAVYTRPYFDDALRREISRANRYGHQFSILVADIEHLKAINHRSGRDLGDRCLKKLSSLITASIRAGDLVARYGPDEFIILLSQCRRSDGVRCAKRVLAEIRRIEGAERFAVSIGILHYQGVKKIYSAEKIVSMANGALSRAKGRGEGLYLVAA